MRRLEPPRRFRLLMIGGFLFATLPIASILGQTRVQDPFMEVPVPMRARLIERLNLLIEYDRTQRWGEMYDLLSDRFTQGETKEHLINRRRYVAEKLGGDELIQFIPQSATSLSSDWWLIRGCGEFQSTGHLRRVGSIVEAYIQDGDWFFSQIRVNTQVDGEPSPCQLQEQLSQKTRKISRSYPPRMKSKTNTSSVNCQ